MTDSNLGDFMHRTSAGMFGPSEKGETLADYRKRVKAVYGNLTGVTFLDRWTKEPI